MKEPNQKTDMPYLVRANYNKSYQFKGNWINSKNSGFSDIVIYNTKDINWSGQESSIINKNKVIIRSVIEENGYLAPSDSE